MYIHSTLRIAFVFLTLCSLWGGKRLAAQSARGILQGIVSDRHSRQPLEGVAISLAAGQDTLRAQTGSDGSYRLAGVPVGRYDVSFALEGHLSHLQPGQLILSGKEARLDVSLEENFYRLDEVNIYPSSRKGTANHPMAAVSALSLDVEETRKFAGGLDDPTRLAANLPGVIGSPLFSENFISVRGNSPRGVLYRLEGVDIPNPTHFARIGSSGGTFTIFSNQLLANSDFFIGAFPADYGNATSSVFDIRFRHGNTERAEYAVQLGVLGVDLTAEGPLSAQRRGSYLVNYRYATLNFARHLIGYLSVPTYQDLSFKLYLPTEKAGTFSLFGISGLSDRIKPAELPENWAEDLDRFELRLTSNMAAGGMSHTFLTKRGTLFRSTLMGAYSFQRDNKKYVERPGVVTDREKVEYRRLPITLSSYVEHRFSRIHSHKSGIILTYTNHDYINRRYDYVAGRPFVLAEAQGGSFTAQAYTQSQLRLNKRWTLNAGLHALYYNINGELSVEPRLSASYQLDPRQTLALGYGLHSQVEDYATYMTRLEEANGSYLLPNRDLGFLKTHHMVLSYQAMLNDHLKFRSELYWQRLFNVPVERNGTYSVVNLDELTQLRLLENAGTGRNYGLDMGLERFSRRGLYYLLNLSLFNSTYTDAADTRHRTAFDNGYKSNLLMGKEYRISKRRGGNTLLGINTNFTLSGGQRYTPIDLEASRIARTTVLDETRPFSLQDDPLFIADLTLTLQTNKERHSGQWAFQIKNIFQSAPAEYREYDAFLDREVALEGSSVFPVISYRVQF
jgi:hypothetical protein